VCCRSQRLNSARLQATSTPCTEPSTARSEAPCASRSFSMDRRALRPLHFPQMLTFANRLTLLAATVMVFHASLFCVALLLCNLFHPCHVVANSRECMTCLCAHLAVWMYLICRAHAHASHLTLSNERAFTLIRSFAASNSPEFFLHHSRVDKIWADWQSQGVAFMNAYVARAKAPRCTAQSEHSFLFPSHGFFFKFLCFNHAIVERLLLCSQSNVCGGSRALSFLGRGCSHPRFSSFSVGAQQWPIGQHTALGNQLQNR
jgi:hypothetical protein